jgi:hypothetical protein
MQADEVLTFIALAACAVGFGAAAHRHAAKLGLTDAAVKRVGGVVVALVAPTLSD